MYYHDMMFQTMNRWFFDKIVITVATKHSYQTWQQLCVGQIAKDIDS